MRQNADDLTALRHVMGVKIVSEMLAPQEPPLPIEYVVARRLHNRLARPCVLAQCVTRHRPLNVLRACGVLTRPRCASILKNAVHVLEMACGDTRPHRGAPQGRHNSRCVHPRPRALPLRTRAVTAAAVTL